MYYNSKEVAEKIMLALQVIKPEDRAFQRVNLNQKLTQFFNPNA